jgi:pimeloyl-[acyl-carrier protein] synthase
MIDKKMNNFDPYKNFSMLREMAPLYFSADTWLVTRYSDISSLLSDKRLSANRITPTLQKYILENPSKDAALLEEILSGWSLFMDQPHHMVARSGLNKIFLPFTQDTITPKLRSKIESSILPIVGTGDIDLMHDIALRIHYTVLSDMFGVNEKVFEEMLFLSNELNYFISEPSSTNRAGIVRATDAIKRFHEIFKPIYENKKTHTNEDLISILIHEGKLNDYGSCLEVLTNYSMLLVGSESTASQIGNTLMLLAENPDQYLKLKQDRSLLKHAIKECLRYEPPIHVIQRVVKEDFSLHGCNLLQGQNISLLIASAHRDPLTFTNPNIFDITRQEKSHLAFGSGLHACIGGAISNQITSTLLEVLLDNVDKIIIKTSNREWHNLKGTRRLNRLAIELA